MRQKSIFGFVRFLTLSVAGTLLLSAEPLKIMPLGDSITYDNSYADIHDPRSTGLRSGYRNFLWYMLTDSGYEVDFVGTQIAGEDIEPPFDPDNEGYPGWTSYDLAGYTSRWLEADDPDIILLHAGSNDWDKDPGGIEMILDDVDRYEQSHGKSITVILALILDRNVHQKWISVLNANIQAMAQKRIDRGDNIVMVDMQNGAGIDYRTDLADPVHPNDLGYQKMADKWFATLQTLPQMQENLANQVVPQEVTIFVQRAYSYILEREADEEGLDYWSHALKGATAASLIIPFFESDEYRSRELDRATALTILYKTLLDREPDEEGFAYWLDLLESEEMTIAEVMLNFFDSEEFHTLCSRYGLTPILDGERAYILSSKML